MMRPDRSDAHLPAEEASKIEEEARRYFEAIAPKRPPKPSRSDISDDDDVHVSVSSSSSPNDRIPELQKFRHLESNPQKLICEGGGAGAEVEEEYVETEYYEDLNCIDKQHHTTGTGFINVERSADVSSAGVGIDLRAAAKGGRVYYRSSSSSHKGNPATNDWIPSADPVIPISNKPSRSDI